MSLCHSSRQKESLLQYQSIRMEQEVSALVLKAAPHLTRLLSTVSSDIMCQRSCLVFFALGFWRKPTANRADGSFARPLGPACIPLKESICEPPCGCMSSGVWLNTSNFNKTVKPTSIHGDSYCLFLVFLGGSTPSCQILGQEGSPKVLQFWLGIRSWYDLSTGLRISQQSHHVAPKPIAKHQLVKLAIQTCKAFAIENQNLYNRMKHISYKYMSFTGVFGASWNAGFGLSSSSTPLWCWRLRPWCSDVFPNEARTGIV